MAKLTTWQQQNAKAWLHDMFLAGGLLPMSKCAREGSYSYMYNISKSSSYEPVVKNSCKIICDEIRSRQFDFTAVDKALSELSRFGFGKTINDNYSIITKTPDMLAKYIAWFCAENDIKWDDSLRTSYEQEADAKTIIGATLREYGDLLSQATAAKPTAKTKTSAAGGASGSTSGYKSSGGHSADIPNLIGTPGVKVKGSGTFMYCVAADKVGASVPTAYITPLKVSGSTITKVAKSQAMTVKFGSGHGYTDCALWFDDKDKAAEVLETCKTKYGSSGKYTGFTLLKRPSSAEYFKVETDLGEAYIKAAKLNEELEEALREEPKTNKIGTLDEEAFFKYYN